jgi:hypothetical protein
MTNEHAKKELYDQWSDETLYDWIEHGKSVMPHLELFINHIYDSAYHIGKDDIYSIAYNRGYNDATSKLGNQSIPKNQ